MIVTGVVRKFGDLIKEAENQVIDSIIDKRIETEPSITDRFFGAVENIFDQQGEFRGYKFRARTLRDRGPGAAERRFGADVCGVLDINIKDFQTSKGFLAQAKYEKTGQVSVRLGKSGRMVPEFTISTEFARLKSQTSKMLGVTPDSYVIVYSMTRFLVVPASSISGLAAQKNQKVELYAKTVDTFFKEFLMCFIGDPRISAYNDQTLESLRRKEEAQSALLITMREIEQKNRMDD